MSFSSTGRISIHFSPSLTGRLLITLGEAKPPIAPLATGLIMLSYKSFILA